MVLYQHIYWQRSRISITILPKKWPYHSKIKTNPLTSPYLQVILHHNKLTRGRWQEWKRFKRYRFGRFASYNPRSTWVGWYCRNCYPHRPGYHSWNCGSYLSSAYGWYLGDRHLHPFSPQVPPLLQELWCYIWSGDSRHLLGGSRGNIYAI